MEWVAIYCVPFSRKSEYSCERNGYGDDEDDDDEISRNKDDNRIETDTDADLRTMRIEMMVSGMRTQIEKKTEEITYI